MKFDWQVLLLLHKENHGPGKSRVAATFPTFPATSRCSRMHPSEPPNCGCPPAEESVQYGWHWPYLTFSELRNRVGCAGPVLWIRDLTPKLVDSICLSLTKLGRWRISLVSIVSPHVGDGPDGGWEEKRGD
jgi:hypothetical protein